MRRAFTLIELLVVISIIALLIAILLPVLSRVKESAARMECGVNSRSLSQASQILAVENDGRYRLKPEILAGRRKFTFYPSYEAVAQDWPSMNNGNPLPNYSGFHDSSRKINSPVFLDLVDAGVALDSFLCPNRPADFVFGRTRSAVNIFPLESPYPSNLSFARTGYEMLSGRYVNFVQNNPGSSVRAWVSPMSLEDPGDLPLNSCTMETTIWEDAVASTRTGSSFAHGPKGYIHVKAAVRPEQTEAEGTNVSANDGSTQFVLTQELAGFNTRGTAGGAEGTWTYADSYDKMNPGYVAP